LSRAAVAAIALAMAAAAGCATVGGPRPGAGVPLVPDRVQARVGPFDVYANGPLAEDDPALLQLALLQRQVGAAIGVRAPADTPPIEVYVLDDRESFEHFLIYHYPELPTRRAFFLSAGGRRVVYAYRGDRLVEDLRHEATHALLNAAVGAVPLWLDEGLAEYFESPSVPDDPSAPGPHRDHAARLPDDLAAGWSPDLPRLETIGDVRRLSPRDYRESWAWAHYLLHGPAEGRAALATYLDDLRDQDDPPPLSARLKGTDPTHGPELLAHLDRLRRGDPAPAADPAPTRTATVRLQEPAPPARPSPIRALASRIGSLFGLRR